MANGGDGCVRTRERESEGEERKNRGRVREYGGGDVASFQGIQTRWGEAGRQASWWRGAVARARRAHSPPSVEDEDDRGGGGLGRLLAGPASYCWAAQGGAPGKLLLLLFIFVF